MSGGFDPRFWLILLLLLSGVALAIYAGRLWEQENQKVLRRRARERLHEAIEKKIDAALKSTSRFGVVDGVDDIKKQVARDLGAASGLVNGVQKHIKEASGYFEDPKPASAAVAAPAETAKPSSANGGIVVQISHGSPPETASPKAIEAEEAYGPHLPIDRRRHLVRTSIEKLADYWKDRPQRLSDLEQAQRELLDA